MNQQQTPEQQLWSYIDGFASVDEKAAIEKLLENNPEWKKKYNELLDIHQLLNSSELEHPPLRFTKNVMEKIALQHIAPATKNYINKKIIWGIAAFFIIVIVSFLVYGIVQINWNETGDTKLPLDFAQVDYSKFFNNNMVNGFMMVNVLLGLALLDRFLAVKRNKLRKETR
ncbi:MAG TPA: hypothetical protein VI548_04900 [Chitinophagaceae bacterium]|nr:hypothetical protein [Chitinophagaceae bacterium]